MMPHVDEFRPVHNLASLAHLVEALGPQPGGTRRGDGVERWLAMMREGGGRA
jgi:hypothetical protein